MTTDSVTVITLTRARPELALRAITSVRGQDYDDDVTHVVIIDECEESADVLGALESSPGRGLSIVQRKRLASEHGPASASRGSVYGRMGRLINAAVAESRTRWIALLDDDNEFTPDHLRSLRDAATAAAVPAAHSHRTIHWADGSAYLLERFPWIADDHLAVVAYHSLCRRGVWERGTNVLKDRAGPLISGRFLNSTIAGPLDPVMMVDHSTWFVDRSVFLAHPLPENYLQAAIDRNDCPDDCLLEALLRSGVPIVCSHRASVRYYLGGISNPSPSGVDEERPTPP
ncbi:MAG: glycosyltransferase family 2 protein [Microthrixaceae bacterium]|nr:glycosyltransferase family 2 protein [Actinomycetota bacterium]HMS11725.1 glycosyltransferase family 2 protein [Microthrixaceae bacterium]HMT22773.1 glycosyltransferase family 2 protein [Microthrixaceae bacterium]HMT63161.1 glycosyltransferase family 2 protein [Microthrixaceae bacterium]